MIGFHGAGPVRRGLWMRRVITQCLDEFQSREVCSQAVVHAAAECEDG